MRGRVIVVRQPVPAEPAEESIPRRLNPALLSPGRTVHVGPKSDNLLHYSQHRGSIRPNEICFFLFAKKLKQQRRARGRRSCSPLPF